MLPMFSEAKGLLCRTTNDTTMPSNKPSASVCAILVLFGLLMIGNGGVSFGAVSSQQSITSSGIMAFSNQYDLIVFQNSTANYLENKQGQITISSSDPTAVINAAIGNAISGNNILIEAGTYVLSIPIGTSVWTSAKNVTLTFQQGAKITVPANFGAALSGYVPILFLHDLSGWTIQGGEIDGNAASQTYPVTDPQVGGSQQKGTGIFLGSCVDCVIQGMYIHDVRIFGIMTWGCNGCKILNNHVSGCGADCIDAHDDTIVQNNLVEHWNDVGLGAGKNGQVLNNTAQNPGYASPGWGGSFNPGAFGIDAEEGAPNNLIQGNTIDGCGVGICQGQNMPNPSNNKILSNTIKNSKNFAIQIQTGNGDNISDNTLINAPIGIRLESNNNIGSGNTYSSVATPILDTGTGNSVS
jgi:parallel beta-helix repeat protein